MKIQIEEKVVDMTLLSC